MRASSIVWVTIVKQLRTMAKIMLGLATLFIGSQAECEAIAQTMAGEGQQVEVTSISEGETAFDVL